MAYDYDKDARDRTRFAQDEMNRRQSNNHSQPSHGWIMIGVVIMILMGIFGIKP